MTPKDTGKNEFEFIKGQKWREVKIKTTEIERFFASRGLYVVKVEELEDDDDCSISISLDRIDYAIFTEFTQMFNNEVDSKMVDGREFNIRYDQANSILQNSLDAMLKSGKIDREIAASFNHNEIWIQPMCEKTYVTKC